MGFIVLMCCCLFRTNLYTLTCAHDDRIFGTHWSLSFFLIKHKSSRKKTVVLLLVFVCYTRVFKYTRNFVLTYFCIALSETRSLLHSACASRICFLKKKTWILLSRRTPCDSSTDVRSCSRAGVQKLGAFMSEWTGTLVACHKLYNGRLDKFVVQQQLLIKMKKIIWWKKSQSCKEQPETLNKGVFAVGRGETCGKVFLPPRKTTPPSFITAMTTFAPAEGHPKERETPVQKCCPICMCRVTPHCFDPQSSSQSGWLKSETHSEVLWNPRRWKACNRNDYQERAISVLLWENNTHTMTGWLLTGCGQKRGGNRSEGKGVIPACQWWACSG